MISRMGRSKRRSLPSREGRYEKPVATFDDGSKLSLNGTNVGTLIRRLRQRTIKTGSVNGSSFTPVRFDTTAMTTPRCWCGRSIRRRLRQGHRPNRSRYATRWTTKYRFDEEARARGPDAGPALSPPCLGNGPHASTQSEHCESVETAGRRHFVRARIWRNPSRARSWASRRLNGRRIGLSAAQRRCCIERPERDPTPGGVERAADARSIGAAAEIHAACCASLDARRGRGFRRVVERAPWMMRQRFPSKRSSASAMKPKLARIRASPSRSRSRKGLRAAKGRYCLKTCDTFCCALSSIRPSMRRSRMFSGSLMRISWAHGKARQGLPFCRPNRRRERRDQWKCRSFWFRIRSRP